MCVCIKYKLQSCILFADALRKRLNEMSDSLFHMRTQNTIVLKLLFISYLCASSTENWSTHCKYCNLYDS